MFRLLFVVDRDFCDSIIVIEMGCMLSLSCIFVGSIVLLVVLIVLGWESC